MLGFGLWAVCLKETGEMIGDCGLTMQFINHTIKPEIGYHIRKDYQRNGYAKEAAIVMREIKKMLDGAPNVKNKFKVYSGLYMKCSVTDAQLGPLSSDANTLDGLGVDLGVVDGYGAEIT